jgi:hypothetical protein
VAGRLNARLAGTFISENVLAEGYLVEDREEAEVSLDVLLTSGLAAAERLV